MSAQSDAVPETTRKREARSTEAGSTQERSTAAGPTESRSTEVYAIHGAEPEVQAYAMAKYSRSALSLKESLAEISTQKAEKFLNTFYFQYGHRSIADLAHIAMAVERLSLLAAIVLEDEQRWDGQERSTRYQDFSHPDYYVPEFATGGAGTSAEQEYRKTIDFLFSEYRFFSERMFEHLCAQTPRPAEMKEDAYQRTLRARAFDIARYLLPLATNTSLGQIVNARTLETQISRLLASRYGEVRTLGRKLKEAAKSAAYNVHGKAYAALFQEMQDRDPDWAERHRDLLLRDVKVSPTLVKYADPNGYLAETQEELERAAEQIMAGAKVEAAPEVDLLDDDPIEIELAASLLYENCHYPYRQIRERVHSITAKQRDEIVALGAKRRGPHDELLRAYCSGQRFRFDILMDIGGFRDLHRHRRCVQLHQGFTALHGYDTPADIVAAGAGDRYDAAMSRAREAVGQIAAMASAQASEQNDSAYLLPLAFRKRTLFKMDLAEVVYITELRTTPAGHFSYRNIAYKMYEAVAARHPSLAKFFRVHDVREPVDLLKR
ncbi:MAG TPA: FAD-dependent thymidylate synthase [Terriglobales bacterium]|nr:FAD-dependent thymidylate synthase [Terriglobales bacterium]